MNTQDPQKQAAKQAMAMLKKMSGDSDDQPATAFDSLREGCLILSGSMLVVGLGRLWLRPVLIVLAIAFSLFGMWLMLQPSIDESFKGAIAAIVTILIMGGILGL